MKWNHLVVLILIPLVISSCAPTPITTLAREPVQAHSAIKDAGETVVCTALSLINETELDITEHDLRNLGSTLNLLASLKAAFYGGDYIEAKNLAEQAK